MQRAVPGLGMAPAIYLFHTAPVNSSTVEWKVSWLTQYSLLRTQLYAIVFSPASVDSHTDAVEMTTVPDGGCLCCTIQGSTTTDHNISSMTFHFLWNFAFNSVWEMYCLLQSIKYMFNQDGKAAK